MEDINESSIGSINKEQKVENKSNKTDDKFFTEAEKSVNRIIQQYQKLLDLSKKYNVEEKDSNFMFNELKKIHDSTKKSFKEADKTSGFSFK